MLTLPTAQLIRHSAWKYITFRKSDKEGFAMLGIPTQHLERVLSRLFVLGCKCLSEPILYIDRHEEYWAVHFSATHELAARMANLFPPPKGHAPLALSEDGTRILYGASATKAKRFQVSAA